MTEVPETTASAIESGSPSDAVSEDTPPRPPAQDPRDRDEDTDDEEAAEDGAEGGRGAPPLITNEHRFLVVTLERFLVLDSKGRGVGSPAVVKSNHHLTELHKMTFRKKDPELITLHFLTEKVSVSAHIYCCAD